MLAIILCVVALVSSWWAGRRSLGNGVIAVIAWGYFYGIIRANVLSAPTYFIFDAALLGLYVAQLGNCFKSADRHRTGTLRFFLGLMILWPLLICFMPFQPLLVSFVGYRAAAFFLPAALLGAQLRSDDVKRIAYGMAILNLAALGFAAAEYVLGIERFYPRNAVTIIIYISGDVANNTAYRLPACFTGAHAYAGAVITTMPFLFGAWKIEMRRFARLVLMAGMGAAILGMLMAASRSHFVIAMILLMAATLTGSVGVKKTLVWVVMIAGFAILALSNERLQRFKTLGDTDMVSDRIAGSVNRSFWEVLLEYPLGNGMGGGGTSMPAFLESQVRRPVGLESEYSRILLEQGIIGLLLWLGFIGWYISRFMRLARDEWFVARRLAMLACVLYFFMAMIGIGLLTSIPQSMLLVLTIGWSAVHPPPNVLPALGRTLSRPRRAGLQPMPSVYAR